MCVCVCVCVCVCEHEPLQLLEHSVIGAVVVIVPLSIEAFAYM